MPHPLIVLTVVCLKNHVQPNALHGMALECFDEIVRWFTHRRHHYATGRDWVFKDMLNDVINWCNVGHQHAGIKTVDNAMQAFTKQAKSVDKFAFC